MVHFRSINQEHCPAEQKLHKRIIEIEEVTKYKLKSSQTPGFCYKSFSKTGIYCCFFAIYTESIVKLWPYKNLAYFCYISIKSKNVIDILMYQLNTPVNINKTALRQEQNYIIKKTSYSMFCSQLICDRHGKSIKTTICVRTVFKCVIIRPFPNLRPDRRDMVIKGINTKNKWRFFTRFHCRKISLLVLINNCLYTGCKLTFF